MSSQLPALDRARVADVVRGTPTSAAQFLAEFWRTIELDAGKLLVAASASQPAQVARFAHRIEGACQMIGAAALARACSALAASAGSEDAGELRTALDAFMASKQSLYDFMDPAGAGAAAAAVRAAPDRVQMCAGLVLFVVEDHDFQRGMIMRQLRRLGASEVHGFAGGADALQAARALPPAGAIMVLDLAMASLGGVEVARIAGAEHLPLAIILHSAQPDELMLAPIEMARSCGANVLGALGKPLTPARLAPLLARHRHLLAGTAPAAPGSP